MDARTACRVRAGSGEKVADLVEHAAIAGGDLHLEAALALDSALAAARVAWVLHHSAGAAALRAGARHGEKALLVAHLAAAVAARASLGLGAVLAARALAGGAGLEAAE